MRLRGGGFGDAAPPQEAAQDGVEGLAGFAEAGGAVMDEELLEQDEAAASQPAADWYEFASSQPAADAPPEGPCARLQLVAGAADSPPTL